MYQYILFDLDGTLTDSREGITKSVQYALDKMGIHEPELKPLERFIGPPLYDEFRRSYGFDDAQAKQAITFYRERFGVVGWKENMLYNGIPELLKALTDAGKTLSTASSKPAFFIDKIVKYFNIDQYLPWFPAQRWMARSARRHRLRSRRSTVCGCRICHRLCWSVTACTTWKARSNAALTASA